MADPAPDPTPILRIYTVYDRPRDYPDEFVVRGCSIFPGNPEPVHDIELTARGATLAAVRAPLSDLGLYRQARHPSDDARIVEVWF
jgi:hypothetical protein